MTRERKPSNQTLQLLSALTARPRQWAHGYDLSMATGLKSGTLYPILMRLSDRGLLEHKWQDSPDPGRPPRHLYRLTADGLGFARRQLVDSESPVPLSASPRSPA
jgi:PadR family transcriptional regulator PadR